MISLNKLELTNFLSHGQTVLTFDETEKLLIDGQSGAGKSTIFDGIIWALFNEGRSDSKSLIRKGESSAKVALHINKNGQVYIIERAVTSSGKHTLEVFTLNKNGVKVAHEINGVKALQEWIEKDLLGMSYLLFINSIAYIQGNNDVFVSQPASKRKELLLEIVKTDDFKHFADLAKEKVKEIELDKYKIAHGVAVMSEVENGLNESIKNKSTLSSSLNSFTSRLNDVLSRLEVINTQLSRLDLINENKAVIVSAKLVLEKQLAQLNSELLESQELAKKKSDLDVKLQEYQGVSLEELKSQREALNSVILNINNSISTLLTEKNTNNPKPVVHDYQSEKTALLNRISLYENKVPCPSKEGCPYYKEYANIDPLKAELQAILSNEVIEQEKLAKWQEAEAKYDFSALSRELDANKISYQVIDDKITTLQALTKSGDELNEKISKLKHDALVQSEISALKEQIRKKDEEYEVLITSAHEAGLNELSHERGVLNMELSSLSSNIETLKAQLAVIEDAEIQLIKLQGNIKAEKDKLSTLEVSLDKMNLLKDALGSKGLNTIICDMIIPRLEDHVNLVLHKLSDFSIRIDTQRAKSDDGVKEGLWITIINEQGQEMDFDNYSGGEKVRIQIAIAEALAALGNKIGFRLVDEAIMGLSPEMTESFTNVFAELLDQYPQMLLISHLNEVKDLFENKLVVRKINGVSTVSLQGA